MMAHFHSDGSIVCAFIGGASFLKRGLTSADAVRIEVTVNR